MPARIDPGGGAGGSRRCGSDGEGRGRPGGTGDKDPDRRILAGFEHNQLAHAKAEGRP